MPDSEHAPNVIQRLRGLSPQTQQQIEEPGCEVYGTVAGLLRVKPEFARFQAVLSNFCGKALMTHVIVSDKSAGDRVLDATDGGIPGVWPLEYLAKTANGRSADHMAAVNMLEVVPGLDPDVTSNLLQCLLPALFGRTVMAESEDDAHRVFSNFASSPPNVVSQCGFMLTSNGRYGGNNRVGTALHSDINFAIASPRVTTGVESGGPVGVNHLVHPAQKRSAAATPSNRTKKARAAHGDSDGVPSPSPATTRKQPPKRAPAGAKKAPSKGSARRHPPARDESADSDSDGDDSSDEEAPLAKKAPPKNAPPKWPNKAPPKRPSTATHQTASSASSPTAPQHAEQNGPVLEAVVPSEANVQLPEESEECMQLEDPPPPKTTADLLKMIADGGDISNDTSSAVATPAIKAFNKLTGVAVEHARGTPLPEGFFIIKVDREL